jgi:hypothetical protein
VEKRHRCAGILGKELRHIFSELENIIGSLDAVLLESNYVPDMLATGSYPE